MPNVLSAEKATELAAAFLKASGIEPGVQAHCRRQDMSTSRLMSNLGNLDFSSVPGLNLDFLKDMTSAAIPAPHWSLAFRGPKGDDGLQDFSVVQVFDDERVVLAGHRRMGDEDDDFDPNG